jgi:hypothetical protein
LNVQVGNPRVEIRFVMGAAAHAIADPRRQHLAAGDALSRPIVGLSFPGWTESSFLGHDESLNHMRDVTASRRRTPDAFDGFRSWYGGPCRHAGAAVGLALPAGGEASRIIPVVRGATRWCKAHSSIALRNSDGAVPCNVMAGSS